jgi:Ca2+-binding RTX toxin-like protein
MEGNDFLVGGEGADYLSGWEGSDVLKGGGGDDELWGEQLNDVLTGGAGADHLHGGSGIDTAMYDDSDQGVAVSLLSGSGSGGDASGDYLSYIENVTGSGHADLLQGDDQVNVLIGLGGDDTLKGMGGADTLNGGSGHDTLDGGAGGDSMTGGPGNDTYYVNHLWDTVTEFGGEGTDTVLTSVSWDLTAGADVEVLRTTDDNGMAAINLTGNASGNQIVGNNGHNIINGGGGVDQMAGRGGNDSYFVDHANDTITESGGQGIDAVYASVSYLLTAGADVETLATTNAGGVAPINLTGNASGNVVIGNNGSNFLNGGGGNDELIGRGGQDYFVFNTALDAATNVDLLSDFNVADDTIVLDDAVFTALTPFNLSAGQFVVGAAAQDADDRIVYNSATGALLYDGDGAGGTAAIQFAAVTPGLGLSHLDFLVM